MPENAVNDTFVVGLVVKSDHRAVEKAQAFEHWLRSRNVEIVSETFGAEDFGAPPRARSVAPPDLFCVFVLGGDGTFLSAVRWIGDQRIPIIGVKFGDLGFLAETTEEQLFDVAEAVLKGEFRTQDRMRLEVKVMRDEQLVACEAVLNDVVINKGAMARLADIRTFIDDHYLTTYRADGLIVSTPTGSTAYALAAGGPIIHPSVPGILLTPICPFTLTNRPLMVSNDVCIQIQMGKQTTDLMVTFDGQLGFELERHDTIIITKSKCPVQMIMIPDQHYFDILKAKLRWSGGRA